MKICTLFLVALTTFVFIAPANGQRRKRETQPQQPKTEQTTPSGDGRRAKNEAAKKPSVPCTVPIQDSPTLRGLALNLTPAEINKNFATNTDFDKVKLPNISNDFLSYYNISLRTTPRQSRTTLDLEKRIDEIAGGRREDPNQPPILLIGENFIIKKMSVQLYGRANPTVYNYQIRYDDYLTFENEDAIKQKLSGSLKIPVGAWVPITDPEYLRKVFMSAFSLLNFQLVPIEAAIVRQADCNGWRAVFVTSSNNTGLAISIMNSAVSDNIEQLIAQDKKVDMDGRKKVTDSIFKP